MPYPNFHAFRMIQPGEFNEPLYTVEIADGITIISGTLKATGKSARQAFRFDRKKFTYEQAKKWMADHGYKAILSEKATG